MGSLIFSVLMSPLGKQVSSSWAEARPPSLLNCMGETKLGPSSLQQLYPRLEEPPGNTQAAELAAALMGKLQLLFDASVQPGFSLFRGTGNTNLTLLALRMHCPGSSFRASSSQHHHTNIPRPTLLVMPPAVPNRLFIRFCCCCLVSCGQV